MMTSQYGGSISIRLAFRAVCTAAISVLPDPPNKSKDVFTVDWIEVRTTDQSCGFQKLTRRAVPNVPRERAFVGDSTMNHEPNPIAEVVSLYVANGRRIVRVSTSTREKHPAGITIKFDHGEELSHKIKSRDHAHLMELWKEASQWFRVEWDLNPLESEATDGPAAEE
jgi:hypothetical protein